MMSHISHNAHFILVRASQHVWRRRDRKIGAPAKPTRGRRLRGTESAARVGAPVGLYVKPRCVGAAVLAMTHRSRELESPLPTGWLLKYMAWVAQKSKEQLIL